MVKGKILNTIFYIVAHADDWQLFMNPDAYYDLVSENYKVIFIVTTAGDAGKGDNFWKAREEGMKSSILTCLAPLGKLTIIEGLRKIKKQYIPFWSVNKVHCYFLRLPDGGVNGSGFIENNYKNLLKLENGEIIRLDSLDGSLFFDSWKSFCACLRDIIKGEVINHSETRIKFLDPANLQDHADHQATGKAVLAIGGLKLCQKIVFSGYGNSCVTLLEPEGIFWKSGMFMAYEKTVFDRTGYSTLAEDINLYKKWIISGPEKNEL